MVANTPPIIEELRESHIIRRVLCSGPVLKHPGSPKRCGQFRAFFAFCPVPRPPEPTCKCVFGSLAVDPQSRKVSCPSHRVSGCERTPARRMV